MTTLSLLAGRTVHVAQNIALFHKLCQNVNKLDFLTIPLLAATFVLLNFANSLDLDQDRQNASSELDSNRPIL